MATKTTARASGYRCSECGWSTLKWVGRCGECQAWGTVGEVGATAARTTAASLARPALRIGQVALDLSFLLVMVGAWLLLNVVATIFGL